MLRLHLRLRNRRGATLVLVAMLIFSLMGITGIAIDLSRAYAFKAELQTTVDAAAMAGAVELLLGNPENAPNKAIELAARNSVSGDDVNVPAEDVDPGTWNFESRTFTELDAWTNPDVNAVRVTATYPENLTVSRVFDVTTLDIAARAIAAIGYVGATNCLRPWAVRYETLLEKLNQADGGSRTVNDDLTAGDINTLTNMSYPENAITLLQGTQNQTEPGNILQVQTDTPWTGNNSYTDAIRGCAEMPIARGDWIPGDPGAGPGQTHNALYDLCNANGGTSGNQNNFTCLAHPRVKLLIWDIHNGVNGAGFEVRVRYIGVFALVSFQGGGNTKQITGYFTAMASDGAFSSEPSPLRKVGMTQ